VGACQGEAGSHLGGTQEGACQEEGASREEACLEEGSHQVGSQGACPWEGAYQEEACQGACQEEAHREGTQEGEGRQGGAAEALLAPAAEASSCLVQGHQRHEQAQPTPQELAQVQPQAFHAQLAYPALALQVQSPLVLHGRCPRAVAPLS